MDKHIIHTTIVFLIVATFLVATVNTCMFVYPSLSRSLLMGIGVTINYSIHTRNNYLNTDDYEYVYVFE